MRIGKLQLKHPFVQAALAGYSDLPMRLIARQLGASFAFSEVVLDKTVNQSGRKQKRILRPLEAADHPVGGQLLGSTPHEFATAAKLMLEGGYDLIDLNFGCPVKKVLGRRRGGFLLSQPRAALDIVTAVVDAVSDAVPVTVKLRKGIDDSRESRRDFFTILEGVFASGVSAVTVHGRTVQQRYIGSSDWDFIATAKKHIGDKTMLGSGDLFSARACIDMMSHTKVDGVTIARGAIGNPWIFSDCVALASGHDLPSPPSIIEQGNVIARHYEESVRVHGERLASRIMRKFGIKYSELHPCGVAVRDAFVAVRRRDCFLRVLEEWYSPGGAYPPVSRKVSHGDLVAAGASEKGLRNRNVNNPTDCSGNKI